LSLTGSSKTLSRLRDDCTGAAWSPDGASIAFGTYLGGSKDMGVVSLSVTGADGSGTRTIGRTGGFPHDLSWSPDGSSIVVETNFVGFGVPSGVFVVDVASRHWQRVIDGERLGSSIPDWLMPPSWSSDGGSIYVRTEGGVSQVDVATGTVTPLAAYP